MQAEVIARAQSIQEIVSQRRISHKLKKLANTEDYNINDYVLWEYPDTNLTKDSRPDRLSSHYRGPYRVISSQEGRVKLQNLISEIQHEVLINQLKPFRYDPGIVDPHTIALHAAAEFFPEKIVDIFGTKKKQRYQRTNLELKVQWKGYADKDNSWVPYSAVKTSDVFIQYCKKNKLEYLLDKKEKAKLHTLI